jgi:uncharacterized protein (DUF488 family)
MPALVSGSCAWLSVGPRSLSFVELTRAIWTIGHSNHTFERFAQLLHGERIEFVVDVRSYPYSRFAQHFNREQIESALGEEGIRYLFLGEQLGGRPTSDEHYDEQGRALYGRMAQQPSFRAAIQRLIDGADKHRVALMCSEADPHGCHRRLLVGKVLADSGLQLRHIFADETILIENTVDLRADNSQETLFGEEMAWRSTQSVSHRRRLSISSAA